MPESHPSVVRTALTRMAPLVAGAALVSATPASAQSTFELLPATDVRPADGAVLSPRAPDTPFRIVTTPGDGVAAISVKVSTRRTTGRNGALASDFVVDTFSLYESSAQPGLYQALQRNGLGDFLSAPGTYYWEGTITGFDGRRVRTFKSRVFSFTVGKGQRGREARLTRARARREAVRFIRRARGRRATHLRAACTPPGFGGGLGPFAYNCTARFRLSGRPYSALLNVFWCRGRVLAQNRFG